MEQSDPALTLAIDRVGSASELARQLGITPAAVLQWERVPPNRALAVERISGVSRHQLRPDIYGPAEAVAE
ncbi:Cro/CI family transcriptional regulator [Rhizobium sp. Root483D2]|uniref:transcriptional regulator n=1 Tax=Rhizobium sp. Root483D2 TaxID=1736545 RepID=UPI0009E6B1FB|nr:Cro/CI family transcriptional regulator [Rhizobium sp. Root483D2]